MVQRERNGEAQENELGYVCECSYTKREFDRADETDQTFWSQDSYLNRDFKRKTARTD